MTKQTRPTTTPAALDRFAVDRGLSPNRLSDAIYDATGVRISYQTLYRFMRGTGRPARVTMGTVDRFMAMQKAARQVVSR